MNIKEKRQLGLYNKFEVKRTEAHCNRARDDFKAERGIA